MLTSSFFTVSSASVYYTERCVFLFRMYYTERKPKNNKEERPGNKASHNGQNYGIYYKVEDVRLVQIASYDFFLSMLLVQS